MKRLLLMLTVAMLAVSCGGTRNSKTTTNPQDRITLLCVNDFADLVEAGQTRVIDVRTSKEYHEGHIAGAENIDVQKPDFVERVRPRTETIAVYCRSGRRSADAARMLAEQGVRVYDLGGGFNAWQQAGRPTVK